MKDFDAVDALLAGVAPEAELPDAGERVRLREAARLTKVQVAKALGISPTTLAAWEAGREPTGETRTRYAYLLDGLRARLETPDPPPPPAPAPEPAPTPSAPAAAAVPEDDVAELAVAQPCVLCGHPARHEVEGFAQHLDPAECGGSTRAATGPAAGQDRKSVV